MSPNRLRTDRMRRQAPRGTQARPHHGRRRPRARALALGLGATVALLVGPATPTAHAAPGDSGTEGHAYVESTNPTISRPESKVWFQDGSWYAAMAKTGTPSATGRPDADFFIYRLQGGTWVPTSTLLDDRGTTKLDVVATGNRLYVAAHKYVGTATGVAQTVLANKTLVHRFTYDPATRAYTRDAGFPKVLNPFQMESLTIDVDATGAIWAAWVQAGRVHWQRSTDGGVTWTPAAALASASALVTADDVASVVSYGNRVGIMWSNQSAGHDGFWFTSTPAGAGAAAWTTPEVAYGGAGIGDDHLNLKADGGVVYAAVKTRNDTGSKPLIVVLRRSAAGTWVRQPAWVGSTNTTRPVLQIDVTHQTAEVFATGPDAAGGSGESGGAIYRKSAPLATLAFGEGLGQRVMGRPGTGRLNDVSGSKQTVSATTGLAVIAVDPVTTRYWHHAESLVHTGPTQPSSVKAVAGVGKVTLSWGAATAGDLPIDHYRVTATPALPTPLPDFPASDTGTAKVIVVPNDVSRVFRVQAVAGGTAGPGADSEPVTPGAYLPFLTPEAFADQQARDFLGRPATTAERAGARTAMVGGGKTGADVVLGAEYFANPSVAGDGTGPEARVSRLYFAYFLRSPDRSGYDYWLRQLDSGRSLEAISRIFAASSEFDRRYGPLTDEAFVELVYRNLFDRRPDGGGQAFWLRKLDAGFPRGSMMTQFSESSEYRRRSLLRVTTVVVYRHLLQRMPTASQLTAEEAKGSPAGIVTGILESAAYADRIVR